MPPEDIFLFGLAYFLVMMAVLLIGLMQGSWHDKSDQRVITFRKPKALRVGSGMFSLLMLAGAVFFAVVWPHSGVPRDYELASWATWLWYVPLCLLMAVIFAHNAGPDDVSIDLTTRLCQGTKGWMFHPRRLTYPLTDASCVCVCSGGQTYYVFLAIRGGTDLWFLLARPEFKSDATGFAQEMADKLHLSVKESSLSALRSLS